MKKILLTGGGTAGHVMPHLALLPYLRNNDWQVSYIGSYSGIEKKLITKNRIPYKGISSGKLRRYFDWRNFTDIFRIAFGTAEATWYIARQKPDLIFSKGGFVTVPVVIGAWINRVPVIIHESDMTPGLANKIALRFAKKICTTFEPTLKHLPKNKAVFTGAPIRQEILEGSKDAGFKFTLLDREKPTILLTGGSLGARALNKALRDALDRLTKSYNVIHLCGKGNLDPALMNIDGYRQYEFIAKELPDLFAMSDCIISRAGSNTITELLALHKPNLLIPLPANQSRGDQILNADFFEDAGFSLVLKEENLDANTLTQSLTSLMNAKETYILAMKQAYTTNGTLGILKVLEETATKD